ncbi:hypothetical protein AB5I41_03370 [Sphingomonas sp. MMS24-JH45]
MSRHRSDGPLCLILLTYVQPLEEVDAQMAAHVAWLEAGSSARARSSSRAGAPHGPAG